MPASKKPTSSAKAEDKVMDVNSPGTVSPSANSRPVIVSNRPMVEDPMMSKAAPEVPSAPALSGKGKTITPASSKKSDKETKEEPAATETAEAIKFTSMPVTEKAAEAGAPEVAEKPAPKEAEVASEPAKAAEKSKETAKPETSNAKPEEKTTDAADLAMKLPEEPADKEQEKKKQLAEKAAAEQAEQEKYEKIIAEKTLFAPIDQSASSSTGGKVFMFLLAFVLLAVIAAVLLIDAAIIETTIELPFDLIQN